MPENDSWTVGRLLTWTTDYLKQCGSESSRLDAELLLAEACGWERIALYTNFTQEVDEDSRGQFRELVKRRAGGEPVAYLVGHREFYSLLLQVTPDVLIPRPETEHLVVQVLDCIKQRDREGTLVRVADVGTGSGAIAVAVATHAPDCHVTAIDISTAALAVAQTNIDRLELTERVATLHSDLLEALPTEPTLDFVLSNPPYVSQLEWENLRRDVKDYEPDSALVGGPSGTEIIQRLVPQAASRLKPGGWLFMEISPMIEVRVHEIIAESDCFLSASTCKDLSGHARVVRAQRTD